MVVLLAPVEPKKLCAPYRACLVAGLPSALQAGVLLPLTSKWCEKEESWLWKAAVKPRGMAVCLVTFADCVIA